MKGLSREMEAFFISLWEQRQSDRVIAEQAVAALAASDAYEQGFAAGYKAARLEVNDLMSAMRWYEVEATR